MADEGDAEKNAERTDAVQGDAAEGGNNETEDQESSPAGEGTDVAADQVANDDPAADAAGQPEQGPDAGASSSGNEDTAQNDPSDQPSPQGGQNSSQGEDKAPGAPLGSGDGAGDADAQQAGEARDKSDSNEADELASGGNDGGYESGGGAAGGDASGGAEGERKSKATPSELQAGNDGGGVDSAGASTALPPVSVKPAPNEGDAPGASPRGEHGSVELRTGRPLVESGAGTSPRGSHSHLALGVRPSVLEAATPLMERTGEIVPLSLSQLSDGEHLRAQIDLPVSFPCPAIVVVGTGRASEARKSHMLRLYQLGVLRAAGYSDAVVIDCGLNTCPSAARIRDKLAAHAVTLGVSPPHTADDMLHKQHHRQLAVEADDDAASEDGESHHAISCAKVAVADGVTAGGDGPSCRAVVLVFHCSQDSAGPELLRVAEERDWRIIVLRGVGGFGDRIGRRLDGLQRGEEPALDAAGRIAQSGRVLCFPASGDPAELSSLLHCCLVTSAI